MVLLTRSLGHRARYEAPRPLSGGRNYRDISDASMFAMSRGCSVRQALDSDSIASDNNTASLAGSWQNHYGAER
jgi:hypothetical protein